MNALALLSKLKKLGINIFLDGRNLKINAPKGKLTPDLVDEIKKQKEKLVEFLNKIKAQKEYTPINPAEKKEYYQLSPAQKRLYFLYQFDTESTFYNIPYIIQWLGEPDYRKLENVFKRLISRHGSLRTSFEIPEDEPVQRIHDDVEFEIQYLNSSEITNLEKKELIKKFIRPFKLSQAPLLRVGLINLHQSSPLLLIDMHHIISDGTSEDILAGEFIALNQGHSLQKIKIQYKDYSVWLQSIQQRKLREDQQNYWSNLLSGELPILNLPTDNPRPLIQSFEGNTLQATLSESETEIIKRLVKKKDKTLYMVVLSLFNILLYKLSNQEDIIVGTPVNGRLHPDIEDTIGMFVNTLPMRNFPSGKKSIQTFLKEVKTHTLDAYENQGYQFDELVEKLEISRDTSHNPVFDVMCNFLEHGENPQGSLAITGSNQEELLYKNPTAKFDLTLTAMDRGNRIAIDLEYSTKLFNQDTILRVIQYFKRLVLSLHTPEIKISEIEIITKKKKKQQLLDFNQTMAEFPREKMVHQLFVEQVTRTSNYIALVGNNLYFSHSKKQEPHKEKSPTNQNRQNKNIYISYGYLHEKTDKIANLLMERGIQTDSIMGILLERSLEMIIGIISILKAGGAYLPIEPEFPEERIQYILNDSKAKGVLIPPHLQINIKTDPKTDNEQLLDGMVEYIKLNSTFTPKNKPTTVRPIFKVFPSTQHLIYVIYTSGSTGKPKGVMVNHNSVVNTLWTLYHKYPFTSKDTYLFKTSIVFDVSVTELFGWFLGGGKLAILEKGCEKDPYLILNGITTNDITHINFVPSMFNAFLFNLTSHNIQQLSTLKYIFLAGEALWADLILTFKQMGSNALLENLYGPTEASIYASGYSLQGWKSGNKIPIGKPLNNFCLYVLSNNLQLQPLGVSGELCIAGEGLARGYLNKPDFTNDRFIPHPFLKSNRIYLTGDLARWLNDGNIEFLGRKDRQIKIRGIRIELGEIENQLLTHPIIKEAAVRTWELPQVNTVGDTGRDINICAYIIPHGEVDLNELKNYISKKLPEYMIPNYFTCLMEFPVSSSGKINRKALPEPKIDPIDKYIAPQKWIEKKLVNIWSEVLGHKKESISINANFFQMGGQSLRATVMVAKIYQELNLKLHIEQIFRTPTIRGLAKVIEEMVEEKCTSIKPVERKEYYSLSSIQKRLYTLQYLENDNTAYNFPNIIVMENVDKNRLEQALWKLISKHETLRTSFQMFKDEPIQKVHKTIDFEIEYLNTNNNDTTASIISNFIRPFDLSHPPLLRAGLYKIKDSRYLLMTDIHHIVSDGASVEILNKEFLDIYNGKKPQPLFLQFKDFVEWQNNPKNQIILTQQEEYWLKEFSGEIPLLNMPIDYERPPIQSFVGSSFQFILDKHESKIIKKIAMKENCTPYMVLFSIYNVLLSKLSGQEEIIVGMVTAGREHPGLMNIIGMFVNTVAVRNFPAKEKTFNEFLKEVKEKILLAYENQDYPLESLVEKLTPINSRSRNPLFDTVFNSREANLEFKNSYIENSPELKAKPFEFESKTTKFDIAFFCGEAGEQIVISMDYSTKLFKKETIKRFTSYFKEIVAKIVENCNIQLKDIIISHHLLSAKTIQPELDLEL